MELFTGILSGSLVVLALSIVPVIVGIVAYFVVRAEEKRLGESLNSAKDGVFYFLANLFLYSLYGGVTILLAQFLLLGDGNWSAFRFGFTETVVSAAFLAAIAGARHQTMDFLPALSDLVSGESPYLKCYAGLNLIVFTLLLGGLWIGGIWGTMEIMFSETMKFEYVSEQYRTGLAVLVTASIMLERNYRWFARSRSRKFDGTSETDVQ